MSTTPSEPRDDAEFTTLGPDAQTYEQYAQVDLNAGVVLLYERANENAWLTSDAAVGLATVT